MKDIMKAKDILEAQVRRRIRGVTGVGVGPRRKDGRCLPGLTITVFVKEKKALRQLRASEVIPRTFEGFETDVVQRAYISSCPDVTFDKRPGTPERNKPTPPAKDDTDPTRYDGESFWRKSDEGAFEGGMKLQVDYGGIPKISLASMPIQDRPPGVTEIQMRDRLFAGTAGFFGTVMHKGKARAVLVTNAHVVNPPLNLDVGRMVGSPEFNTTVCSSSDDMIGRVLKVRLQDETDCALVALEPGGLLDDLKYTAQVHDGSRVWPEGLMNPETITNNFIRDTHEVTAAEIQNTDYIVYKRGCRTGVTKGKVVSVGMSVDQRRKVPNPAAYDDDTQDIELHIRQATNQLEIESLTDGFEFAVPGDSGSAVLDSQGRLVGLVWGQGGADSIRGILTIMGVTVATANARDVKFTIPDGNLDDVPVLPEQAGLAARREAFRKGIATHWEQLRQTPYGSECLATVARVHREALYLVRTNKRAYVEWNRHGGPLLLACLTQALISPTWRFPSELEGISLDKCVDGISNSFRLRGNPGLGRDVDRLAPLVARLGDRTMAEVFAELGA
jgi:hypothetical protein